MYTKLDQLDYSAELAQIRAAKPAALYVFLPGGMGINFIKQFVAAGLSSESAPGRARASARDQDIIRAGGRADARHLRHLALGLRPRQRRQPKFVAAFEKEYNRIPSLFAEQGYTTALLIDAAVRDVKGKIEDVPAFHKALIARRALRVAARRVQVRAQPHAGPGLLPARGRRRTSRGRLVNKKIGTVFKATATPTPKTAR